MGCEQSGVQYRMPIGSKFCAGYCGGQKTLMWQTMRYVYYNGYECADDEYVGCC